MSKSPSLRRIQADIRELALDPSDQYFAAPLENDMFEWHFTIRGAEGTDFEGGIYHGRILLPPEYPYKPPHIVFLTPSGRFETNTKVCLSFSAFHPELWQPAWGIRLILEALISFLPTPGDGAIGALDYKPEERRRLAKLSQSFCCPICGPVAKLLPKLDPEKKKSKSGGSSSAFSKEIAELQRLQQEREGGKKTAKKTTEGETTKGTTVAPTTSAAGEAEAKTKAGIDEATKLKEEVPELLPSDADIKKKAATTATKDSVLDGAFPSTNINTAAAASIDTDNGADSTADSPAGLEDESSGISVANANNAAEGDTNESANDLSNFYDPLLNISILLMFCICVLLWKKGMDLSRELSELRVTPMADSFLDTATSAASSVAASAAASEEL